MAFLILWMSLTAWDFCKTSKVIDLIWPSSVHLKKKIGFVSANWGGGGDSERMGVEVGVVRG